jgi:aminomethyltransferase
MRDLSAWDDFSCIQKYYVVLKYFNITNLFKSFMKKTRLYSCYSKYEAKIIDFFGWRMPLEFSGIVKEHNAVRENAGLFDVSHMGEIIIKGKQALDLVQILTPNDAARLSVGKAQYSALTTPAGTFVDDLLVYCLHEDEFLLVVNAANTTKDFQWICQHAESYAVEVENVSHDYTQLALQGPGAVEILQPLTDVGLDTLTPFGYSMGEVVGEECLVSRTGYTGEDGFEIYTRSTRPEKIWNVIMDEGKDPRVLPIGLGARDTLRLEATLMLYGNDIDETTTVLEANLGWLVKFKKGDFLGRQALLEQREKGISKRIAGFEIIEKGIARSHYSVFAGGQKVSEVTSGTYSPFLKKSIGLTYLPVAFTEPGTEIWVEIHGRRVKAEVILTPFYKRKTD